MAQSARNCKPSPFIWALENLEKGFVELLDIKEKFDSNVSSLALGHVIKTLFKNITIKSVRSERDWSKMTQLYYLMDQGFWGSFRNRIYKHTLIIAIAKNMEEIKIGHFTGEIKNGS